ncbi:MAG: polymerase subunit delta [Fibrobacterota bacterium]|jgi:DNA polymerase-3 subunit delta'
MRACIAPETLSGLQAAASQGRFPSVLLLTVPRGEGLPLLLDLAQALLCPNTKDLVPCGNCPDCTQFASGHSRMLWLLPNVSDDMASKIEPYGPEHILKDPWTVAAPPNSAQIPVGGENTDPTYPMMVAGVRGLAGRLAMAERKNRVVFVPYADQLNQSSSNALLKILEEPPDRVHFVMAATAAERVLPTIRSRSFLQNVSPLSTDRIEAFLKQRGIDAATSKEAASRSLGRAAAALRLCTNEAREARKRARQWLDLCKGNDPEAAFSWIQEAEELSAKDRRSSQILLETALGELEERLRTTTNRPEIESLDALRQGLEKALKDISNHAKPQMAFTAAWLGAHA